MAFSLSSVGQYLGFAGSNPFVGSMDLFQKNLFLAFRGFGSYRRRDGSVLEGTICKQFVMSAKNRKNLKPCRGFKSFRSLVFRIQFMKKCVFGSSNPSTRRKIENGSMEIRKKLGAKKAEKSFEISAFLSLLYHKSDIFSRKNLFRLFLQNPLHFRIKCVIIYPVAQGYSSAGRVPVSKTVGRGFESSCPCHHYRSKKIRPRKQEKTGDFERFLPFFRA